MATCPTCGKELDTTSGMRKHHAKVHDENLPNRTCQHCDTEFYDERADRKLCPDCKTDRMKGERNPNWKGGVSDNPYRYKKKQRERYPKRVNAREKALKAKRKGELKEQPCAICESMDNLEMHHEDYDKPLDVTWLCRSCHRKLHQ